MTNTIRIMRALALTLAATAALASACGGSSGEPQTAPPVSTSPASASSPTAAPTGKDAPTPEGAAAFAKYFYAQIELAFARREPAQIQTLSAADCSTCNNLINSVKGLLERNERAEGFHSTVTAAVAPATTGGTARVDVIRDSTGTTFLSASGKVVGREPALKGIEERMDLVRAGAQWRVAQIVRVRVRG